MTGLKIHVGSYQSAGFIRFGRFIFAVNILIHFVWINLYHFALWIPFRFYCTRISVYVYFNTWQLKLLLLIQLMGIGRYKAHFEILIWNEQDFLWMNSSKHFLFHFSTCLPLGPNGMFLHVRWALMEGIHHQLY